MTELIQQYPQPVQNTTPAVLPPTHTTAQALSRPNGQRPSEPAKMQVRRPLRIYSYSPLFYWWPVWVFGFVMALLTYWQGMSETDRGHPGRPGADSSEQQSWRSVFPCDLLGHSNHELLDAAG